MDIKPFSEEEIELIIEGWKHGAKIGIKPKPPHEYEPFKEAKN